MAKTVIDSRGVVTSPGSGIDVKGQVTLRKGTKDSVNAITAATTVTVGGVYTVSGSSALTVTLPDPGDVPGSHFVFRAGSDHAHLLSSSQVTQDTQSITDGTDVGTRAALSAVSGSSALMVSDGQNYLVLGSSGSVTLATPSS